MARQDHPTVKDEDAYEALRRQGSSKSKAVRIANSGKKASKKGGKAPSYEQWTKSELYERAKELEISGRSHMSKDDLIGAMHS